VPALTLEQIAGQLSLAVDRVMGEGSLYDPELAALAIKQARGDLIEAVFLLRAYRTTLPRFGHSEPIEHRRDAGRAARLGDLQGPAGRPIAWPDLRLHAPAARSGTGGDEPSMRPRRRDGERT
jgi:alpha-D-ribose 1-methylphosphonate 5-triphosphate synthase subunit PhnI